MGALTEEIRDAILELTDPAELGEPVTILENAPGVTPGSDAPSGDTLLAAEVTYSAEAGGYVPATGEAQNTTTVETATRGILTGRTVQPRASNDAVQAGSAVVIIPRTDRDDGTTLVPAVGNYVRFPSTGESLQVTGVKEIRVQGGAAGYALTVGG